MYITNHARKRIKERCGIQKKASLRKASIAFENGLKESEVTGKLKKYFSYLRSIYNYRDKKIRIYGEHVYIFKNDLLITVFLIDPAHKNALKKAFSRKNKINNQ